MEFAGIGSPGDMVSASGHEARSKAVPHEDRPRKLAVGAELARGFEALLLFENAKNKTF
jgi:hypothetical protein